MRIAQPDGHVRDRSRQRFSERYHSGELKPLTDGPIAQRVRLAEQYRLHEHGDVARRLDLHRNLHHLSHVGTANYRHFHYWGGHRPYRGYVSSRYTSGCLLSFYFGPSYYPRHCWYPRWSHWVQWAWHYHCPVIYDPRPIWCRPVVYEPAPYWVYYQTPVWVSLPVVSCGTWVDVDPVVVDAGRYDLQLLAVRFVDAGHPEEKLGPRYRVWFRNNSEQPVTQPFNVVALASKEPNLAADTPQAGVRVATVEAGQTQSVDVRLPWAVYEMGRDDEGQPIPFANLHVLIDADREIPETFESNNGIKVLREEVLPVDPAAFELEPVETAAGTEVLIAGEGFGPEPGQVLVHLGNVEMQGVILGWYDLGVKILLPELPLAGATEAELIVIRGDGAAANPLKITITPPEAQPELIPPPAAVPQ